MRSVRSRIDLVFGAANAMRIPEYLVPEHLRFERNACPGLSVPGCLELPAQCLSRITLSRITRITRITTDYSAQCLSRITRADYSAQCLSRITLSRITRITRDYSAQCLSRITRITRVPGYSDSLLSRIPSDDVCVRMSQMGTVGWPAQMAGTVRAEAGMDWLPLPRNVVLVSMRSRRIVLDRPETKKSPWSQ